MAFFSLHERVRGRSLRRTHVGVLVGNVRVIDGIHPLGESHSATGRHQLIATLQRRGVAIRVGLNLLVVLEGIILRGSVLRDRAPRDSVLGEGSLGNGVFQREGNVHSFRCLRLISSFSRIS